MPSITSKRRQLPSIEEAWNLPISNEMSSRQQQNQQRQQQYQKFGGPVRTFRSSTIKRVESVVSKY